MKQVIFFLAIILIISCKNEPKDYKINAPENKIEYPNELIKVFENHGGLDKWKLKKSMSYEIVKEGGNERQFIDLQNRKERIEATNFTSGYDGKDYWIEADTSYTGNVKFYTNLMFYFYAMPFVLADDGINYEKTKPIEFEGKAYPGYRISYGDDIGISPEDEYFIHYNPKTYEMVWLGYTVTFYSGKKSEKIKYIRYNDWKVFDGLKLPNSLTWYNLEEGKLIEPRNTRTFDKVIISESKYPDSKFVKTKMANIVE